jgi:hypothetical protein
MWLANSLSTPGPTACTHATTSIFLLAPIILRDVYVLSRSFRSFTRFTHTLFSNLGHRLPPIQFISSIERPHGGTASGHRLTVRFVNLGARKQSSHSRLPIAMSDSEAPKRGRGHPKRSKNKPGAMGVGRPRKYWRPPQPRHHRYCHSVESIPRRHPPTAIPHPHHHWLR